MNFTVTNVTNNGNTDTVNVTFPDELASMQSFSVNGVSAEDEDDNSISIEDDANLVDDNTVQFTIANDSGTTSDIEFKLDVTTEAPEVSKYTEFGINASFVDNGADNVDSTEIATLGVYDTDDDDSSDTGYLSGRVSDSNNNDVTGVTVQATNASMDLQASTTTNENGEYTLRLPEGEYDIKVLAEDYETATSKDNEVAAGSTTSANLVVEKIINPDNIEIVESDTTAVADGEDQVSYTVNVTTDDRENSPSAYEGATVVLGDETELADGNFTEISVDTNASGLATFTANSTEVGEFDIEFELDSNSSVNASSTATFRPVEGNAQVKGDVVNNETEAVSGATVWVAYQGENQTLTYAQENQEYLVSQTNADGEYSIEGIVAEGGNDTVNVYVLASGYNADNETDMGVGAWVAANETQTVYEDATENHDFILEAGGPAQEYRLNVTVEDQKSVEAPIDSTVNATVHVEQRQKGSSLDWNVAEDQEIEVSPTNLGPVDPNSDNVTTNADGEAKVTFTAKNTGDTNITAMTTSDEGTEYNTTGSEQASVSVFGTGSITGDVVNENDNALARGQATVQLFVNNSTTGEYEPVKTMSGENRTSTIGDSGSYVFTDVRSGEQYRMVATTVETNLTGQATTVDSIPAGTTTNDIVVVGATPNPADFQVSDLNPQDVTVTQGDNITVSATITNDGVVDDTQTVEFQVGGDTLASEEVTLNGSETTTVEFTNISTSSLDAGDYTHGVYTDDGEQTATLTVESSNGETSVVDQFDENNDGEISQDELTDAAIAFSAGDITQDELTEVAIAFSTSS